MVTRTREPGDPRSARRLNEPRPVHVVAVEGVPIEIDRVPVATVREEWLVADRWWTDEPLERRYVEAVLATGENAVVFLDEKTGRWYRQRA